MAAVEADVVVAGGGPAGLATAIGACRAGLEVVVLEAQRPPIDKACGEGVMPDGAAALEALGVELPPAAARPFRGVRYIDGAVVAEGSFPGAPGLGIRRTVLHDALRRRAEAAGAKLRWSCRVTGLLRDGFATEAGPVRGRWLVAADGRASSLRPLAGLAGRPAAHRRFGVRRHFEVEPWSDLVEVHWADGCEAYVTPVGERLVGVAILWSGGAGRFDELLARFPALAERLAGAEVASRDRGAGPLAQRCRRVARGRLALVGDAAGYLDAITGEGLALAFREAAAAVEAIAAGDLRRYVAAHRRIVRHPLLVIRMLLLVERLPRLRRRVMTALAAEPGLMSRFLALKLRAGGPRLAGGDGLLRLALATVVGGAR
ncbi:MAG: NAD(P)/FAD-dependent oxidoreductase [Thermoanaerobaculales bacterium]|nr:NAD(P)/FAD-dependent oxidoreductase [Thermoanaerobaculales bacterium]